MQEPICPCKSAPAKQKVHHILSAICPLKIQKSTEKNTKVQNCHPSETALLCGFSDFIESCRNPNSIFNSRTGHHTRLLTNGLTKPFVSFYFFARFWVWSLLRFFWSLRRENGFFAALRFLFVKGQRFCDCLTCPRLCFLEHMTVNVARR